MDISIFTDKNMKPDEGSLAGALKETYPYWVEIGDYVKSVYPAVMADWSYPGPKYGWSFRMKDKKRVIIYLLPRDSYFKVAFVFGQKVYGKILESKVCNEIKNELSSAREYAEGRGIRIEVRGPESLPDIRLLIDIKVS